MNRSNVTRLQPRNINKPSQESIDEEILEEIGESTPEIPTDDSGASEDVYQAYGVVKSHNTFVKGVEPLQTQEKLTIRKRGDSGYEMPYSLVILRGNIADHTIMIYCTGYAVIIEGRNLTELLRLLASNKVKWIQEFDGKKFSTELDDLPEDEPVITEIKVKFGRE